MKIIRTAQFSHHGGEGAFDELEHALHGLESDGLEGGPEGHPQETGLMGDDADHLGDQGPMGDDADHLGDQGPMGDDMGEGHEDVSDMFGPDDFDDQSLGGGENAPLDPSLSGEHGLGTTLDSDGGGHGGHPDSNVSLEIGGMDGGEELPFDLDLDNEMGEGHDGGHGQIEVDLDPQLLNGSGELNLDDMGEGHGQDHGDDFDEMALDGDLDGHVDLAHTPDTQPDDHNVHHGHHGHEDLGGDDFGGEEFLSL